MKPFKRVGEYRCEKCERFILTWEWHRAGTTCQQDRTEHLHGICACGYDGVLMAVSNGNSGAD